MLVAENICVSWMKFDFTWFIFKVCNIKVTCREQAPFSALVSPAEKIQEPKKCLLPQAIIKEVCLSLFLDNERLNVYCTSLTCTSPGLKRNCLLRLDFSMVSISVTNSCPASLQAKPIMAKFLRCSHPIAPAPTCNNNNNNNRQSFQRSCRLSHPAATVLKVTP